MIKRLLFALITTTCALMAQTDSGAIRVFVADSSDAPVDNASVRLTNAGTGIVTTRSSDSAGYATFAPVPGGNYTLNVEKPGFEITRVTDISLDVNENKLVRVTLSVSTVNSTVEVSAAANIVQSEQASLGQVVQGTVGVDLPLAARRYTQLALLVPGTTQSTLTPSTRGVGWFTANGNFQTQNNFILDGVDNNQGTNNAQSLSSQVVAPSPDAIAEFKVQTNSYSAEFGRSAGAVVNVVLKSGTNQLSGSAWYYNRNSEFAANAWASNLAGAPKSNLSWNQFGGTLGGPIVKNKIFYFVDYEGFREDYSTPFIETVPTAAEHQGIFYRTIHAPGDSTSPYPNNTIPASMIDPMGAKLLALYPAATIPGTVSSSGQTINNYSIQAPSTERDHKGDIKGDYNITDKDVLSLRFSYLRQDIYNGAIFPGIADGVGNQGAQFNTNQSYGGGWTRIISPTVVNFLRFGYTSTNGSFSNASVNGGGAAAFGFQIPSQAVLPSSGGLPLINPSNYNNLGTRGFRPQYQKPTLYQVIDSLSLTRGAHSIRFGFETRQKSNTNLNSNRTVPEYDFNGNFTGESLADMMMGQVYNLTANTQEIENILQKAYAVYVQDDWKIRPNLTLNMGLRWEYETPFYGANPFRNVGFNFQTAQLMYSKNPTDYMVNADHLDFGPRVGLAWQAIPNKLIVRGGYGIFYSGEDMSGSDVDLAANPPNLISVNLTEVGSGPPPLLLSQPVPSNLFDTYDTTKVTLTARQPDYHAALIHQFNVAVQYQLPAKSTIELAYVGNRGYREFAENAGNQVPFGLDGSVAANRPYPEWNGITVGSQVARSWYNSLQAKYNKQLSNGWYALFSYTFASAIDEAGAWGANTQPQIAADFALEKGPQAQTPRQTIAWSNIYDLPFGRGRHFGTGWNRATDTILGGWRLSNILTWHTGLPLNITLNSSGVNPANNQNYKFYSLNGGTLRPNRVGNPQSGISPETNRNAFLNVNAFQVQTLNTPGNASRDVALGPGFFDLDLSLAKQVSLSERVGMEVRLEAFNSLNNVNFGNPATTFGSSNFGSITSAGDPRIVQMAIRVHF